MEGQLDEQKLSALSLEDQFLLVLIRLKLGMSVEHLAYTFGVNVNTLFMLMVGWPFARWCYEYRVSIRGSCYFPIITDAVFIELFWKK